MVWWYDFILLLYLFFSLPRLIPVYIQNYEFLGIWALKVKTTEHDGLYKGAKSDFESFVESISKKIVENVDETIPELPLKDLVSVLCFACCVTFLLDFLLDFSRPAEIHHILGLGIDTSNQQHRSCLYLTGFV